MASTSHDLDVTSRVDPPHVINKRPKDDDSDGQTEPNRHHHYDTFGFEDILSSSSSDEPEETKLNTLVFPLTDSQLKSLRKEKNLRVLTNELSDGCTLSIGKGLLNLRMPAHLQKIKQIHALEKRLGVLLSLEEIAQIRRDIRADGADADSINELKLNDRDFFNKMVQTLHNGTPCIKHRKNGAYDTRYVLVRADRLYWKDHPQDRHEKKRSFHLTKIVTVMIGKCSKPLLHESLAHIPELCCFSVVTRKATLDLTTATMDPIVVRKFVAYLKGIQRHFLLQYRLVDVGQSSKPPLPHIDLCRTIGQGFEPKVVQAEMTEDAKRMIEEVKSQEANVENKMVSRQQIESLLQHCTKLCVIGFHIDTEVIRICEAQVLLKKYGFDTIHSNDNFGLLIGIKNH